MAKDDALKKLHFSGNFDVEESKEEPPKKREHAFKEMNIKETLDALKASSEKRAEQNKWANEVMADKALRHNLDENLQDIKRLPDSRERSLAITKVQEAIMWLGMDLKRLNEKNPYPESYNPNNTVISKIADGLKL